MGERKGTNKYYPPDFDPAKHGSLNKYHGSHPLRERARKLSQGILVIRFEMPFNIWCDGCQNHIGMGVRYNAEKKKVGTYYTTPVYRFRMKCHLCVNYIELQTDPGNCDYVIVSGARRKEERWDPGDSAQVLPTMSSSLSQSIPVLPVPRCWQQDGHWDSLSCVPNLSQSPRVAPSASSGSQCPAAGTRTGAGTASAVSPVAPSAPSAHSLSQSLPVAPSAPSSSQSIPVPPVPPSALSAPLLAPGWALGQPQPRPQPVPVPPSAPSPSQSPQSVPVSPVPPNVPSPSQCPQSPQCRCPRSPGAAGAPGPGPHVPAGARRVGQGGPGARRPHADAAAGGPARLEGRLRPQQPPAQEIPGGEEDAAGGGGGGGGAAGAGRAQHPAAPRGGGGPAPGRAAQPARPRLLRGEAAAEALRDLAALLVRPRHGPSARRDPPQIGAGGGTSAQGTAGTTADPRRARHRAAESGGGRRGRGGAVPGDPRGRAGDPRGRGRPPGAPRPVPRRRLLGLGLREPLSGVLGVRTSPQRPFPSVIYIPAQLRIKSREWPVAIVACRCCAAGRCRRRKGRCPSVCPSVRGDGARVAALPARLPGAAEPAAAAGAAPLRAGGGRGAGLGGDPRHGGAGGSGHRAAGLPEPGRGAGGGRGARRGSGGSAGVRGAEIGVPADRPPHGRQPGPRGRAAPRLRPAAGGDPRGHPPAAAGEHH